MTDHGLVYQCKSVKRANISVGWPRHCIVVGITIRQLVGVGFGQG